MSNTDFRRIDPSYDRYMRQLERSRRNREMRKIGDRAGDCVGNCRGNMANLDCAGLANEKRQTQEAWTRQKLASESYDRNPADRQPPPGYSNATDADLRKLGLVDGKGQSLLNIDDETAFNAAVFRRNGTDEYVIGFRGSGGSLEDWTTNAKQWGGGQTRYYDQAVSIARRAERMHPGKIEYVGHSLGGGLASAAARASGRPATTFNAAGLHPNTVRNVVGNPPINAWYVDGEILSSSQGLGSRLGPVAAGRHLRLVSPPSIFNGALPRHLNGKLDAAFERRMESIEELRKKKGCP